MRVLLAILLVAATCSAQSYTQRGFLESRGILYPQDAKNDRTNVVGDSLFRYESFYKPKTIFRLPLASIFVLIHTSRSIETSSFPGVIGNYSGRWPKSGV